MKRATVSLMAAMFILSSVVAFADDEQAQNTTDQDSSTSDGSTSNAVVQPPNMPPAPNMKDFPKPPAMPTPPAIPNGGGMMGPRTVVATSDGGIVIVDGNKITKLDNNLNVTKSIELDADSGAGNGGGNESGNGSGNGSDDSTK